MFDQLFIYFLGITVVSASNRINFFRRDYTFLEEYNAFYKLHWADDAGTWDEAFLACDDEGAGMFYPEDVDEWQIARNLSDAPDLEGIFVGVHDELGRGDLLTYDGNFLPEFSELHVNSQDDSEPKCVVMSVNTGRYSIGSCKNRKPFICKKKDNEYCPTVDAGYIYSKTTKKCYKVHKRETTWEDAMHTCYMEGGILSSAIHSSELNDILNMITEGQQFFMGFRRIMPQNNFYSIRGIDYDLNTGILLFLVVGGSFYYKYICSGTRVTDIAQRISEKINILPRNEGYCGAVTVNEGDNGYNNYNRIAKYSTHPCYNTLPFICELDVKL